MLPILWSLGYVLGYVAPLKVERFEHGIWMFSNLGVEHFYNIL